jgi:hypothetical protein
MRTANASPMARNGRRKRLPAILPPRPRLPPAGEERLSFMVRSS